MELQVIHNKIYEIRGMRVMLDRDLAELYGVETRVLNQAVKRHAERFPEDFMFQLSPEDIERLRSQIVILNNKGQGNHLKYMPYAFTEQGVAMLSSVLRSDRAIEANIVIIRAFVAMRHYITSTRQITAELELIREKIKHLEQGEQETIEAVNDLSEDLRKDIDNIYLAIGALSAKTPQAQKPRRPIGYRHLNDNDE